MFNQRVAARLAFASRFVAGRAAFSEALMAVYSKILVPVDFSEHSVEAVRQAREIAGRFNAELHLVTVVEPWPPAASMTAELYPVFRDYVLEASARATAQLNELAGGIAGSTPVHHVTRAGHVQQEIVKYIEENGIDLVVLGTHGRSGLSHWFMGSVAEKVARFASCSVLIAREHAAGEQP
jgi:nucleotide-binding universal stress UspA family protein